MRTPSWAPLLLGVALLSTGCVTLAPQPDGSGGPGPDAVLTGSGAGMASRDPATCGGEAVPRGWPDFASGDRAALLAPFLKCTSPAEFITLQDRVDMPRLVAALDDWRAVRLGAQGVMREDAARILNRKRASLLVKAPEAYGALHAEVLAVFIVDSAHDDDLREILFLLAQDKRLEETLALLPSFRVALEHRGLKPTARTERDFELADLGRGVGRALTDALSSSPASIDGADFAFLPIRGQLPPEYQDALDEAERLQRERHFSAGNVALGGFDSLTFGVPLGFYGLLASTGQGAQSLARGKYEQATRELAPAALLVALYAGGKGARYLSENRGTPGMGLHLVTGIEAMESRLRAFAETARQLQGLVSLEGLRELARYIRASREAGRFVALGGPEAALALYEAGGHVAQARPLMSKARPGAPGSPPVKSGAGRDFGRVAAAEDARAAGRPGTLASLVDEGVGHTREVVDAKLAAVEFEATGPRLPKDVGVLEKHRPTLEAPPHEARGNPRWREYIDYYEKRFSEVKKGEAAKGPLKWDGYERMRGWFDRGLAFERSMVKLLQEDAKRPRAERRFLGDFDSPRIETHVGVRKQGPGLRYADVLVIEEGGPSGRPRRVETFSFKSRDLSVLGDTALEAQMIADARAALAHYGETLDIRRGTLQSLLPGGSEVQVPRVRLVYEGGNLMPKDTADLDAAVSKTQQRVPGVEVLFQ